MSTHFLFEENGWPGLHGLLSAYARICKFYYWDWYQTGKKQLDRELLLCGDFLTFFYKRQYQDFKDFHHHPHPLHLLLGQPKYKVSGTC